MAGHSQAVSSWQYLHAIASFVEICTLEFTRTAVRGLRFVLCTLEQDPCNIRTVVLPRMIEVLDLVLDILE